MTSSTPKDRQEKYLLFFLAQTGLVSLFWCSDLPSKPTHMYFLRKMRLCYNGNCILLNYTSYRQFISSVMDNGAMSGLLLRILMGLFCLLISFLHYWPAYIKPLSLVYILFWGEIYTRENETVQGGSLSRQFVKCTKKHLFIFKSQ